MTYDEPVHDAVQDSARAEEAPASAPLIPCIHFVHGVASARRPLDPRRAAAPRIGGGLQGRPEEVYGRILLQRHLGEARTETEWRALIAKIGNEPAWTDPHGPDHQKTR